jgi:hypothetical protein
MALRVTGDAAIPAAPGCAAFRIVGDREAWVPGGTPVVGGTTPPCLPVVAPGWRTNGFVPTSVPASPLTDGLPPPCPTATPGHRRASAAERAATQTRLPLIAWTLHTAGSRLLPDVSVSVSAVHVPESWTA